MATYAENLPPRQQADFKVQYLSEIINSSLHARFLSLIFVDHDKRKERKKIALWWFRADNGEEAAHGTHLAVREQTQIYH